MRTTKKNRIYSIALVLLGTLFSCQNESIDEISKKQDVDKIETLLLYQEIAKRPQLSKDEALELASEVMETYSTRSHTVRKLKSIEYVISSPKTRTTYDEVDTTHYIINYADNEGFLILSGDKRVMPILGYSEKGSLDWSNIPQEIGLYAYKKMLPIIEERERKEFEEELKQLQQEVDDISNHSTRGTYNQTTKIAAKLIHQVAPLVKVEWGQGRPYNFCAKEILDSTTNSYKKAYLGCGPLSIAMVMSVYKYPKSIKGKTIDWDKFVEMNKISYKSDSTYTEDELDVFNFLRVVADSVNAKWGLSGTSIKVPNVPLCFKRLGYSSASNFTYDFSSLDLVKMINEGNPVLIGGSTELDKDAVYSHMWVCDGYKNYQISQWRNGKQLLVRRFKRLFHCNWGWSGDCNGDFYFGKFAPYQQKIEDITKEPVGNSTMPDWNFSYQNYIFRSIKP